MPVKKRPASSVSIASRDAAGQRIKRDELKTYRELELGRSLKSAVQRRRLEANGLRRVLGDGSSGQPYLVVETKRYRQARLEVQRRLLLEARRNGIELSADILLRQLRPRIEALAYAQLAEERSHETGRHVPVAALGRALTPEERGHFAASRAAGGASAGACPAALSSSLALNHVLGRIEQRQTHNPARYQTIWAGVVGAEVAQQSWFDHVDAATGTAWFRCANATLSYSIQRRADFTHKLARALGLPVRQLRVRF